MQNCKFRVIGTPHKFFLVLSIHDRLLKQNMRKQEKNATLSNHNLTETYVYPIF